MPGGGADPAEGMPGCQFNPARKDRAKIENLIRVAGALKEIPTSSAKELT
jgi:hypothetical protein